MFYISFNGIEVISRHRSFKFGQFDCVKGLTTRQPLWVILCPLQEKGRRELEEKVEEMKERDRGKRKMNKSEEIKTFPF